MQQQMNEDSTKLKWVCGQVTGGIFFLLVIG
jgi:hypothetical protein